MEGEADFVSEDRREIIEKLKEVTPEDEVWVETQSGYSGSKVITKKKEGNGYLIFGEDTNEYTLLINPKRGTFAELEGVSGHVDWEIITKLEVSE